MVLFKYDVSTGCLILIVFPWAALAVYCFEQLKSKCYVYKCSVMLLWLGNQRVWFVLSALNFLSI